MKYLHAHDYLDVILSLLSQYHADLNSVGVHGWGIPSRLHQEGGQLMTLVCNLLQIVAARLSLVLIFISLCAAICCNANLLYGLPVHFYCL